jgi:hypothetical protein
MLDGVRKFQEHGIMVWAGGMVGFDHDDISIFHRVYDFFQVAGITKTSVHIVYAPDGTPLKERISAEGRYLDPYRIVNSKSQFYDLVTNLTIIPKRMTIDQLQQGTYWLVWELNKAVNQAERLRVFFETYEKSPKKGKLGIPTLKVRRDLEGLKLIWRMLNFYCWDMTHADRVGFNRMIKYALRSSHPQWLNLTIASFMHSQNVKKMLLMQRPDAPTIQYPQPIEQEDRRSFVSEGEQTDCVWDRNSRLTGIIRRDAANRVIKQWDFDPQGKVVGDKLQLPVVSVAGSN